VTVTDFIGTKYTVHGRTLEEGLDCYGVIFLYYKEIKKIILPDPFYSGVSSSEKDKVGNMLLKGIPAERIEKPETDCLISIKCGGKLSHIGLYLGNGMMLHSTHSTGCVIQDIQRYSNKIEGFYRVVEQGQK